MLYPIAELCEYLRRHVGGYLCHEKDSDTLAANQPNGLRDGLQEILTGIGEEQVSFIEKENELRLVEIADLRQVVVQVGQQPHQERREQRRLVLHSREFKYGQHAFALRRGTQEVGRVE